METSIEAKCKHCRQYKKLYIQNLKHAQKLDLVLKSYEIPCKIYSSHVLTLIIVIKFHLVFLKTFDRSQTNGKVPFIILYKTV